MNKITTSGLKSEKFTSSTKHLLIDGSWKAAQSGKTFDIFNPATGERFATVAEGDSADVNDAVKAARRSFEDGDWRKLSADDRCKIMWRIAELIDQRFSELAELETLSMGTTLAMAGYQIAACSQAFRYYAGWVSKIYGQTVDISQGPMEIHAYTRKEPIGVVGLITPWNAPALMACWKIAPALAAGCSFVMKPSEEAPLSTLLLGELMLEAGVPKGVANIITGFGATAGAALADHPDVNKISFTGSTTIGKVLLKAAAGNLKRLTLELGGKSPFIICDDADLDRAIPMAGMSIFANSGQVCIAGSRLFVQKKVFDKVVAGISERARTIKVGDGMDPTVEMGPLVSEKQFNTVTGFIESGRQEGAEVVAGGGRIGEKGWFIQPTVFAQTTPTMRVVREEIFGPVVTAIPFDSIDEIPALANDTNYGLAAYVFTQDLSRAHKLAARIQAGTIGINCTLLTDYSVPLGGYKQSGWGREHGSDGILAYMETKSVLTML